MSDMLNQSQRKVTILETNIQDLKERYNYDVSDLNQQINLKSLERMFLKNEIADLRNSLNQKDQMIQFLLTH